MDGELPIGYRADMLQSDIVDLQIADFLGIDENFHIDAAATGDDGQQWISGNRPIEIKSHNSARGLGLSLHDRGLKIIPVLCWIAATDFKIHTCRKVISVAQVGIPLVVISAVFKFRHGSVWITDLPEQVPRITRNEDTFAHLEPLTFLYR